MEHNPQNRFTISSEYEIPADAIFDLGGQQISVQFGVNIATQLDVVGKPINKIKDNDIINLSIGEFIL